MAKAREIKRRIRSIDNTRQITKTMEMVAASKLKRASDRVIAARPFDEFMRDVIAQVRAGGAEALGDDPLLREERISNRAAVLVVTSNRGLAGAFNANLVRQARTLLREIRERGLETELHVVGRKGAGMLRYLGDEAARTIVDLSDRPTFEEADAVAGPLVDGFVAGTYDEVHLVYSLFKSPVEQRPTAARILPLPEPEGGAREAGGYVPVYEFLPGPGPILARVLPLFLKYGVYRAIIESAASEHGARRTAMKNATDNAKELIRGLTRTYNRARQAQITQEIAELVGGSESLRA